MVIPAPAVESGLSASHAHISVITVTQPEPAQMDTNVGLSLWRIGASGVLMNAARARETMTPIPASNGGPGITSATTIGNGYLISMGASRFSQLKVTRSQ